MGGGVPFKKGILYPSFTISKTDFGAFNWSVQKEENSFLPIAPGTFALVVISLSKIPNSAHPVAG